MEINLSKDYKEEEKTPVGFEESDKPAPGFEYEVNDGRSDNSGAASFCTRCGTPLNGSSFCPNCGHAAETIHSKVSSPRRDMATAVQQITATLQIMNSTVRI